MIVKIIIILLIAIVVIAILVAAKEGIVYQADVLRMQDKHDELERELLSMKYDSQASQFLIRRIELASNLQIELIRTNARVGYTDIDKLEKARKETYDQQLHFSEEQMFFDYLDKELNDVHKKLIARHPELPLVQQQLCMLLLMQAPTTDIEMLLHYSPNSLPKIKTRLAKKLSVNGRNSIYNYLLELIARPE